jgi:hypothetical protein
VFGGFGDLANQPQGNLNQSPNNSAQALQEEDQGPIRDTTDNDQQASSESSQKTQIATGDSVITIMEETGLEIQKTKIRSTCVR